MAKPVRTGARSRASRTSRRPRKGTGQMRQMGFSLDLLIDCRRRIVTTTETTRAIAASYDMDESTIRRLAAAMEWPRPDAPVFDLPPATRLAAQAEAVEQQMQTPPAEGVAYPQVPPETVQALIDALRQQISLFHDTCAGKKPQSSANTLATLTRACQSLMRTRASNGLPQQGYVYDDDMPEDIDAFRDALARKLEIFLESREAEEGGGQADTARGEASRP